MVLEVVGAVGALVKSARETGYGGKVCSLKKLWAREGRDLVELEHRPSGRAEGSIWTTYQVCT